MELCFETIKVKNGEFLNLKYHQKRVDLTRDFFGFTNQLVLNPAVLNTPKKGEFRCRIDYLETIKSCLFSKIPHKELKALEVVHTNINYNFKYSNRDRLESLKKGKFEVLIIKNDLITDLSFANIALKIKNIWLTPKTPLLSGTTRARLIDSRFLKPSNLTLYDYENAENFAIMNALIGFNAIGKVPIISTFD